MSKLCLVSFFVFCFSCSNTQEPFYSLFDHSYAYPDYIEFDYLKFIGFKVEILNDSITYLSNFENGIFLRYKCENDELISRDSRMYIPNFDTTYANTALKSNYHQLCSSPWLYSDDSTAYSIIEYENDTYTVFLKRRNQLIYLQTITDLFHRITH